MEVKHTYQMNSVKNKCKQTTGVFKNGFTGTFAINTLFTYMYLFNLLHIH